MPHNAVMADMFRTKLAAATLVISSMLFLLFFVLSANAASDVEDEFVRLTTEQITLIWEHTCMKHMEKGEWHQARQNKKAIDWQRANKKGIDISGKDMPAELQYFEEARIAKAKAGEKWGCNPPEAKLELRLLKIGRDPQIESPITTGFVSSDADAVEVRAAAEIVSDCDSPRLIWFFSIPKYGANKSYSDEKTISHRQSIPPAPGGDRGKDFNVEVKAELSCKGILADNLNCAVGQDEKDQLRQEYIDMKKAMTPAREDLTSVGNSKHFSFDDFNRSMNASGEKYPYILCRILDRLEAVKVRAGAAPMAINSGFRNPYKNGKTPGSGRESMHIYGLAADIALDDFNEDGKRDEDDWKLMARAARAEGACVEPIAMAPSWVHMDWRGTCPNGW
ncbi:MAG: D-Ala-D-Ala carboxypeptidase family metallohydrolase [Pseudomonadota bacterium]